MNRSSRITKNSLMLLLANGTDVVFRLLVIIVFARYLGVEIYGKYAFLISIVAVAISIPNFGMERIVMREVGNDKAGALDYLSSLLFIRLILSGVTFISLSFIVASFGISGQFLTAFYILMISEILFLLTMSFINIFLAFEKMEYKAIINIINRLTALIIIIVVISLDLGFIPLLLGVMAANFLALSIAYVIYSKVLEKVTFTFKHKRIKTLIRESFPLFLEMLLVEATMRMAVFILKIFRNASEISLFFAPFALTIRLKIIPMTLTTALFPYLNRLAVESIEELEKILSRAFRFFIIISLPAAVTLTVFAEPVILLLFGDAFIDSAVTMKILSWAIVFMFLESLLNAVIIALKKQWFSALSQGVMFIVNLVLDLLLIPMFGYLGASIGLTAAYFIKIVFLSHFVYRHNISPLTIKNIPGPIISSAIMWIAMGFIYKINEMAALLSGPIIYLSALLITKSLSREDLSALRNALRIKGPSAKGRQRGMKE